VFRPRLGGCLLVGRLCERHPEPRQQGGAALRPTFDVPAYGATGLQDFGQCEVKARFGARSGPHVRAKARPAGAGALHGDDEPCRASRLERPIRMRRARQHPILDGHRRQLAGAHPDQRRRCRCRGGGFETECAIGGSGDANLGLGRRVEEALPAVRPHRMIEKPRIVGLRMQTVVAGRLLIAPASRQSIDPR